MDITKEISEAIVKHLPGAVGAELQAVLAQGKSDAVAVVALNAKVAAANKIAEDTSARLTKALADLGQHGELRARELAVKGREDAISIRELQQELAAEKRISAFATDTVGRLVRNVDYRQHIHGSVPVPVQGSPGGNGSSAYGGTVMPAQIDKKTDTTAG